MMNMMWIVLLLIGVPITKLITSHLEERQRIKASVIKDQLELERIKNDNFIMETEKMRLELERMKLQSPPNYNFEIENK